MDSLECPRDPDETVDRARDDPAAAARLGVLARLEYSVRAVVELDERLAQSRHVLRVAQLAHGLAVELLLVPGLVRKRAALESADILRVSERVAGGSLASFAASIDGLRRRCGARELLDIPEAPPRTSALGARTY